MREATDELVGRFERGVISRRELVAALLALATQPVSAAQPMGAAQATAPRPIQVSGIDHVAFRVSDVQKSARFYTELFGATVRSQSETSVFLDVGSDWVALFARGVASTGYGATAPGVDHLSFRSTNARSAADRMAVLREHGLDPVSPAGSGRVYFKDPDGNILQLS
jgi:catechol 2,3-dioxygenase-like lactoylglutathione lyase family enzyme